MSINEEHLHVYKKNTQGRKSEAPPAVTSTVPHTPLTMAALTSRNPGVMQSPSAFFHLYAHT